MLNNLPRVLLAGTGSSCGKTTMTCALLGALQEMGKQVVSFKCGPDYIDPMFHRTVLGLPAYNLDAYLCDERVVALFSNQAARRDISVIEGVMGLYDGIGFCDDRYSTNALARLLRVPTLLVLDVRGKGLSLLAELAGYLQFRENCICGVLLNRCKEGMYPIYRAQIEKQLGLSVYGYLPPLPEASIGSRHLGLLTAQEVEGLSEKLHLLTETALHTLDLAGIVHLAEQAEPLEVKVGAVTPLCAESVRIAVAKDEAFCFYYADALECVTALGATLVPFSPLHDHQLPEGVDALWLGGGYPEEHLEALSRNWSMKTAIRHAVQGGLPTYAECGGFLYLGSNMTKAGEAYPLVDAIPAQFEMQKQLVRFGYAQLTAKQDSLLFRVGDVVPCHEFHYSDSDQNGEALEAVKESGRTWHCGHVSETLFAGFPHLHLGGNPALATRFVQAAIGHRAHQRNEEQK